MIDNLATIAIIVGVLIAMLYACGRLDRRQVTAPGPHDGRCCRHRHPDGGCCYHEHQ